MIDNLSRLKSEKMRVNFIMRKKQISIHLKPKNQILFLFTLFPLVFLLFACCCSKKTADVVLGSIDKDQMAAAFDRIEIIGEGTDFLTVKVDLPQTLSPEYLLYALMLDGDGYPLSKISGYTQNPHLKGKNHIWFYFFLFTPDQRLHFSNKSEYIKFIVAKENNILMERVVRHQKHWSAEEKVKIFDLPSPTDQIKGYLVLKDYTFWAKGDFRKPRGYYVEGKIIGCNGRWNYFTVLSDIQGQEPEPEFILPVDQGWLELETGKTHSTQEAISPSPPYVKGWWDGKGYFHPHPVKVFGSKLKKLK